MIERRRDPHLAQKALGSIQPRSPKPTMVSCSFIASRDAHDDAAVPLGSMNTRSSKHRARSGAIKRNDRFLYHETSWALGAGGILCTSW